MAPLVVLLLLGLSLLDVGPGLLQLLLLLCFPLALYCTVLHLFVF